VNKAFVRESDSTDVLCPRCGAAGISATPTCGVAYFDAFEAVVPVEALTASVYPKDPGAPLCPCFGLTMEEVEADVAEGTPTRIRALLAKSKTPAARCDELSPTGHSCIPDVQKCYFKLRGGT
jgi:hypothetical protein